MAKRRKRKTTRKSKPKKALTLDPARIESMARQDLANGEFRRAREGFRRLLKGDHEAFGPLYLEATKGYLDLLVSSDRLGQAQDVINQTRKLLGDDAKDLEKCLLSPEDRDWDAEAREAMESGSDTMADRWVLASNPPPNSNDPTFTEDGRAIKQALEALAKGDKDAVEVQLRPIGRRSAFADWKIALKAFLAFRLGETERATKGVERLRQSSNVPGKLARALHEILTGHPSKAALALSCWCLGESDAAALFVRAEAFWKAGKALPAYKEFEKHPDFPCASRLGLWGCLTDLLLGQPLLPNGASNQALQDHALSKFHRKSYRSKKEEAAISRAILYWHLASSLSEDEQAAHAYASAYSKAYGDSPKLSARIFTRLVEFLEESRAQALATGFMGFDPQHFDRVSQRLLDDALALDPELLEAHMLKLRILRKSGETSKANKWLDGLTKRFPENKAVLLESGIECVRRKAYVKGMGMLRRAHEADPLDRQVRAEMILALAAQGFRYAQQKKAERARALYPEMEALAAPEAHDYDCGLSTVRLHQWVIESFIEGSIIDAPKLEEQWPSHFRQFAQGVLSGYHFSKATGLSRRCFLLNQDYLESPEANGSEAILMYRFHLHFSNHLPEARNQTYRQRLDQYIGTALDHDRISSEDARRLILTELRKGSHYVVTPILTEPFMEKKGSAPFFAIADKELYHRDNIDWDDLEELREDVRRAEEQHDQEAVALGKRLISRWEPLVDDPDDEPFDIPLNPFGGASPFDDPNMPNLLANILDVTDPDLLEMYRDLKKENPDLDELLVDIINTPPHLRYRMSEATGTPKVIFDLLAQMADKLHERGLLPAASLPSPPPKKTARRPATKKAPKSSPDQLDLFDS